MAFLAPHSNMYSLSCGFELGTPLECLDPTADRACGWVPSSNTSLPSSLYCAGRFALLLRQFFRPCCVTDSAAVSRILLGGSKGWGGPFSVSMCP